MYIHTIDIKFKLCKAPIKCNLPTPPASEFRGRVNLLFSVFCPVFRSEHQFCLFIPIFCFSLKVPKPSKIFKINKKTSARPHHVFRMKGMITFLWGLG